MGPGALNRDPMVASRASGKDLCAWVGLMGSSIMVPKQGRRLRDIAVCSTSLDSDGGQVRKRVPTTRSPRTPRTILATGLLTALEG